MPTAVWTSVLWTFVLWTFVLWTFVLWTFVLWTSVLWTSVLWTSVLWTFVLWTFVWTTALIAFPVFASHGTASSVKEKVSYAYCTDSNATTLRKLSMGTAN